MRINDFAKKSLALLLAAVLLVCLLPFSAFAAGESGIQLGTGGIGTDDEIYFGTYTEGTTYNVPWQVLSKGADEALLLSKYLLGDCRFSSLDPRYNTSELRNRMDSMYNGAATLFTSNERGAVKLMTNLECPDADPVPQAWLYPMSSFDEFFNLPQSSCIAYYITNTSYAGKWWLRSTAANVVMENGSLDFETETHSYGVRPAFNLNLGSVLFTSAATGGKASGALGKGALNANLTPSGTTEWKLTLSDSIAHGSFNVSTTSVSVTTAGGDVSIAYSGAAYGTNEFLSAMLTSGSGTSESVLYYGRLKSIALSGDASGTQAVTIPALSAGTYTLKIFNEQYNGDEKTDYSSALMNVTLTVGSPASPAITTQPANQTVEAGQTATFSVAASGNPAPSYQWWSNTGSGWTSISGATNASYTTAATSMADSGNKYRCYVSNSQGNVTSNEATLTVNAPAATYAVTVNLTLDGNSYTGRTVTIQQGTGAVYTLSGTGGTYSNSAVPDGTYTIYKDSVSTGKSVTVNGAAASTTLDFFTVSFNANGGTPAPADQVVIKDGYASAPAAITKGTDTFGGWYSDSALSSPWTFATSKVTSATTLYAKWTPQTVATPTFSVAAGTYHATQRVTLSCATSGATIRYTTDNSEPTSSSTAFVSGTPISISATTTLKAKAFKSGMTDSSTASAAYTITPNVVLSGGSSTFVVGDAARDAVFTIGAGIDGFNATTNYDRTELGGVTLTNTQVTAADGSIILTFKRTYLNSLPIGTHTATVYLKGTGYAGAGVPVRFTVSAVPSPSAPGRTNPVTGVNG